MFFIQSDGQQDITFAPTWFYADHTSGHQEEPEIQVAAGLDRNSVVEEWCKQKGFNTSHFLYETIH